MKRVFKLLRANPTEIRVFATSVMAMSLMRIALVVVPLRRVIEWINEQQIEHQSSRVQIRTAQIDIQRAALRITQAAAFCPLPTTCLSRTLAAHLMMSRLGFSSVPRIGVSTAGGSFEAHAWLECQDGLVIGHESPDGKRFTPLASIERFFV